jgi:hypothetical protein
MIRLGLRRHPSTALLLGRLTTGQAHARRGSTLDNRIVDQSQSRNARSAYRDRTTELANRSILKEPVNALQQYTASGEIPITSDARPRHTSCGFLPWRFAYAGPPLCAGPPS